MRQMRDVLMTCKKLGLCCLQFFPCLIQTLHSDIATNHALSERSVRSTISLGLLAPEIVEAAIHGRRPYGLTVTQLSDLPSSWVEQKQVLGLDEPQIAAYALTSK